MISMKQMTSISVNIFILTFLVGFSSQQDDKSSFKKKPTLLFNHMAHLIDEGMECSDCHASTRGGGFKLPKMETCSECHDEALGEPGDADCMICHTRKNYKVKWTRRPFIKDVHRFHLKAHTNNGSTPMKCTACHAKIYESTTAADNNYPTMRDCGNCHRHPH